jgi:C-terminal processing protease CtpA/Prc
MLVGLVGGCLGGGLAGYLLARGQVQPIVQRLEDLESNSIVKLPELLPDVDKLLPELLERFRELDPAERQQFFDRFQELQPEMPDWFREFDPEGLPEFFDEFGWPELPGDVTSGALIQEVVAGTPAEEAGLLVGDLITAVDDQTIDETHPLQDVIAGYEPEDSVVIRFVRGGQEREVTVLLAGHPEDPQRPYLGVYYVAVSMQQEYELSPDADRPSG